MFSKGKRWPTIALVSLFAAVAGITGCSSRNTIDRMSAIGNAPTELKKITLPEHVIAPPDILLIDAVTLIPRPPYLIKPLDALFIQVRIPGAKEERPSLVPGQPIDGIYRIEPDGTVNLGFDYGSVKISGQGIADAKNTIKTNLLRRFKADFDVIVSLAESRAMQQIRGEHLVHPDGKVVLGNYGSVVITGLTLEQAKVAIQDHLSKFLLEPEISLDIAGFNSRVYYVIFDLDGAGQQVHRLPVTGNETVIDAIAELKGLPAGTFRKRIWVARPSVDDSNCNNILPVNWDAISSGGSTLTNYQLMPGDRVFVSVDPWIATDNYLAKVIAPLERILGITLLGNATVRTLSGSGGGIGSGIGRGVGGF